MARSAELLARLNPTTCRLDVGRGGVPELTNIDIAGALGMVRHKLGRSVLEATAWDRNAPGVMRDLRAILAKRIERRMREAAEAVIDAELAEFAAEMAGDETEIRLARQSHERAKLGLLPANRENVRKVLDLVLTEFVHPNLCPICHGRKEFVNGALVVECHACGQTGRVSVTDEIRAKAIGMSCSGWRKSRERGLHAWLCRLLGEAAYTAEGQLSDALERCP